MTTDAPDLAGAFSAAQRAALEASDALAAAGITQAKIYSGVIEVGARLPLVAIGEDQILTSRAGECGDEAEIFATVHVHAKGAEAQTARRISAAVKRALLAPLDLPGAAAIDEFAMADERYVTDPDQSTHVVLVFHYLASLAEPAAAPN